MTGESIQSKLDILRENLERMDQIPQRSFDEFASDFRNLDSAQHRLQTSIQALIDLGSHRIAHLGLTPPETSREILEILQTAGHLPEGSVERFGPIFGFRNRIVHMYDKVDPKIVYEILLDSRRDLGDLLRALLSIRSE